MSDERKIDEELESEDDVEAHKKGSVAQNDEGDDGEDDVVAHKKGLTA